MPYSEKFKLRMIQRSTAPRSGARLGSATPDVYSSEEPEDAVQLRATADPEMSLWITDIRAERPRVKRVEYLVDGRVAHTVEGEPENPWDGETYPVRHAFGSCGYYDVGARVHLVGGTVLTGGGFEVRIDSVLEPWMLAATSSRRRNLLSGVELTPTCSSSFTSWEGAEAAFDDREDTRWLSGEDDEFPVLAIELNRAVRADRIVLNQSVSRMSCLDLRDRIIAVEIRINDNEDLLDVWLSPSILAPTVVDLPQSEKVRSLEVRVLERTRTARVSGVGFTEITLERAR